jgi:hypothetical protein|tara:strand:- start:1431 stop:1775 length:345 start_codon:yes stop_codon:yes gene_type:complete
MKKEINKKMKPVVVNEGLIRQAHKERPDIVYNMLVFDKDTIVKENDREYLCYNDFSSIVLNGIEYDIVFYVDLRTERDYIFKMYNRDTGELINQMVGEKVRDLYNLLSDKGDWG